MICDCNKCVLVDSTRSRCFCRRCSYSANGLVRMAFGRVSASNESTLKLLTRLVFCCWSECGTVGLVMAVVSEFTVIPDNFIMNYAERTVCRISVFAIFFFYSFQIVVVLCVVYIFSVGSFRSVLILFSQYNWIIFFVSKKKYTLCTHTRWKNTNFQFQNCTRYFPFGIGCRFHWLVKFPNLCGDVISLYLLFCVHINSSTTRWFINFPNSPLFLVTQSTFVFFSLSFSPYNRNRIATIITKQFFFSRIKNRRKYELSINSRKVS